MSDTLYAKEIKCPVCEFIFTTQKVKTSSIRIEKRDTDFCVYYAGDNPLFYGVYVCPSCGFAALESGFENIGTVSKKIILDNISSKWMSRDFGKERNIYEAIDAYKLALLCGQLTKQKNGVLGSICLRLAWLYRYLGEEREYQFLKYAAESFEEAFRYEKLPIGGLDDLSITYLIGETKRRLEKYEDAIYWFNKALRNPGIKQKKKLEMQIRDQWRSAREHFKHQKNSEKE